MGNVYVIEPEIESKFFPEKIEAIFSWDLMDTSLQSISTCILRDHLTVIGFGWAIENPNDDFDLDIGEQWAYKRAIKSMTNNICNRTKSSFSLPFRKEIDTKMRQALYKARNENGK